jgi:hypothetical protein
MKCKILVLVLLCLNFNFLYALTLNMKNKDLFVSLIDKCNYLVSMPQIKRTNEK